MSEPLPDAVLEQLERVLSSRALNGSDQLKRLLRLVVERALHGQAGMLKEYNLGLEVFQRPPDYDPKVDPIVRVQARRLRAKLEEYYAGEGAADSLMIQIPKGGYAPLFQVRTAAPAGQRSVPGRRRIWLAGGCAALAVIAAAAWTARSRPAGVAESDRGVAVLPLKLFDAGSNRNHVSEHLTEVLTTALAKQAELRVVSRTTASKYGETKASLPEIARELGVRWVIEGGVGLEGGRAYVKLRAVDASTDRKVWADAFDCEIREIVPAGSRAAQEIAGAIAARRLSP